MNELALYAGIGGGILATKYNLGWRTVCYVENAKYPVGVIKARIDDGLLDDAPIWDDARTFDGYPWAGYVDVITAGFPCQPFSNAGRRAGAKDDRNGWPDTIRIIREVRPRYVFLENVPSLLSSADREGRRYYGTILGELAESGYDARWRVLSAAELGAPHLRKRLWIVAHATTPGSSSRRGTSLGEPGQEPKPERRSRPHGRAQDVPYTGSKGLSERQGERSDPRAEQPTAERGGGTGGTADVPDTIEEQPYWTWASGERWWKESPDFREWPIEPSVCRVVNGHPGRVDRIKGLGNAQVPRVVATAWRLLTE